tara:strand:+ start:299 stop:673 length:375 start_codon:yes stop_codon:yes gene_type:complete
MTNRFNQLYQEVLAEKKKGVDGKACWKGYRHAGTEKGKDKCVKVKEAAKCTKATKKASSTSKGKKWMKCVKSDSGGYKRIHWGQKGAKVTGKSGNTKRKKSFRARHKCSTAKSNTPRGQACKDW